MQNESQSKMIFIPKGTFLMGSDPSIDALTVDCELPQHLLYLNEYFISETPITNLQYKEFLDVTGYQGYLQIKDYHHPKHWVNGKIPDGKENHPVTYVNWYDALAYCQWLSEITGQEFKLPSEAEWEKAARGIDGRIYPWGNQWNPLLCNSRLSNILDTTPVDAYPDARSPYGLFDVAGNAWEWTRSLWGIPRLDWGTDYWYPYNAPDGRENQNASDFVRRCLRGGSFYYDAKGQRCAFRDWDHPYSLGCMTFRVLKTAK